ncbi:MAG: Uma2 family endonuclease [Microscillaceae bacterium]|jgi:Uma2 family endonuclease|nr:Uma2 family endonuclease [Microscillaceae bacterium]
MIQSIEKKNFTRAEYLAREEEAEHKSEYHNGEILAMSGGSLYHNIISVNFVTGLKNGLKGKTCRPFNSDMKLEIASANHYVYPDAMVVCGKVQLSEGRNDMLLNPSLIAEVLSPSTMAYDRGDKFRKYLTISTLLEYVMIFQEEYRVEVYFRESSSRWIFSVYEGLEAVVNLASIDLKISMADIYEGVENEESEDSQ